MNVALIGAHGKVGRLVIPLLADHEIQVSGIVRHESQLPLVEELGGTPVLLDVENATTEEITEALRGHDAVVWSAGAGGGDPDRTYAVDRDAAIRSIDAAAAAGVSRYVMVSWIGSVPDHGIAKDDSFFPYADAKLAADDHLRGTDLDWTILGPGTLTNDKATGTIDVGAENGRTSRGNVALVVAQALRSPSTVGQFVRFVDGETPVLEVFGR
ncbi:SDR family oxidoreductase [Oerskovia turbata]|uniref:SDR family oxidoreductase n=1 Tax=Oerskovia turbata TaxID=1713 RepID=A0A4Q1KVD6_9CELL|nr:SDR family oxidoreductase [Oerskovia turbata]RXR25833.1 SDR family oxidoreductase [Oerskovia turbata]RXR33399.1 SDR family oxidoreductase [Oerskovia turbata]TGJ96146.1 SDR family NAD(P)-dependent oxidoreductase [Actinotalea fermentans ATCC 43279 = JCM 9966 = DSM 3133]